MIALRKDAEAALGDKFNTKRFHDFILLQGIQPPALISEGGMNEFVPAALHEQQVGPVVIIENSVHI